MSIKKTSITLDGLKYNLDDKDRAAAQAAAESDISFTGSPVATGFLPSFTGLTVSGSVTQTATTAAADTVHTHNFTGAAADVVTLPAATEGTRVVYVLPVDTTGGTNTLSFYCAGSDVIATGQVVESRNSNAVVFDTSTAGETKLVYTPANAATNFVSQGSRFYFWCTKGGEWNVHLEAKSNPASTGLTGACAFAS